MRTTNILNLSRWRVLALLGLIAAFSTPLAWAQHHDTAARAGLQSLTFARHVDTPFIRDDNPYSPNDARTSIDNPENYERRRRATPAGRLVMPEDVAKVVLFAVSDEAAMITGSMITVDGGAALN